MTTDFTNNNTTINTSGGFKPTTKNTPLDVRTRVNTKADIDSIPNPFVGMKIIVLQDETNGKQMTEYVVTSLKANSSGVADTKVNEVVLTKDFLGVSSGSGMTSEQVQQLNTAYTHSQTPHVQQSDIPTKTSQLQNDTSYVTEDYVSDYTGGKKQRYITQAEYNALPDVDKNDQTIVWNIIDAIDYNEDNIPTDLSLDNNTLYLVDSNGNNIGNGVVLDISNDSNDNDNQEPVYETRYVDLTFDVNTDSLTFESNVKDCTCGLEYSNNATSSDVPPFTLTSKNDSGQTVDTFVSSSDDKTIDIVSGGSVSITGEKPTRLVLTNVKTSVLVNDGSQNDSSIEQVNIVNLHNVDRLLFLGDSYTEGMYYQKGKAFVCQLSEQLDYSCEAYGWGDYTCETLSNNIDNNLSRFNPIRVRQLNATRAMLMSFVNDMAQNTQNSLVFQRGMERLINTVKHMGCQPIVCTEYRNVWGAGLEPALKALAQQYQCDFWNILPYSVFLNTKNASDDKSLSNYYAGSHPGQRTGGIIFNNYLKFAKNLPRPTSAIKIFRLRADVTVNSIDDLSYDDRRGKLIKFKEIHIAHSALTNASDWDSLGSMTGTSGVGVTSEYGILMNNGDVNFGDYALVECVLPSLKGNISSVKLCLSDKSVEIYAKTLNGFVRVGDAITSFDQFLDYDKITFLLHKKDGFVLNDIYVEWKGTKVNKHSITCCPPLIKGAELLKNNTVDDMTWLTVNGTVTATDPTNYTPMPIGCTKLITVNNTNNVSFGVNQTFIPGMSNNLRVRVVCRYNPANSDSSINENSYDRKLLALRVKGQYSAPLGGNSYYELLQEVDMAWTMCEFDVECNENTTFTILSPDTTNIEVCYISVIEQGSKGEYVMPEVPEKPTLVSISAIYTQGEAIIYPDSSLDDLRSSLDVTANYSNGSRADITDYSLSGNLTIGTSIITVSFEDKTTTFNVEVSSNSQPPVGPVSYTNYIYNEDTFTNPAAGTTPSATTYYYMNTADTGHELMEPGILKIYNITEGKNAGMMVRHGKADNNIYYIQFKVKSEAAIIAGSPQKTVVKSDVPLEDWTMVSFIYTDTIATMHSIKLTLNNNGAIPGVAYIKELMRINLTEIYGAGNEPSDVSACDELFATFVPGLRG